MSDRSHAVCNLCGGKGCKHCHQGWECDGDDCKKCQIFGPIQKHQKQ